MRRNTGSFEYASPNDAMSFYSLTKGSESPFNLTFIQIGKVVAVIQSQHDCRVFLLHGLNLHRRPNFANRVEAPFPFSVRPNNSIRSTITGAVEFIVLISSLDAFINQGP